MTAPSSDTSTLALLNSLSWLRFRYEDPPVIDDGGPGTGGASDDGTDAPSGEDDPTAPSAEPVGAIVADAVTTTDGAVLGDDLTATVALLGKAIAELSTQVADLKRQVEQKPANAPKYPWEPGWSPFQ